MEIDSTEEVSLSSSIPISLEELFALLFSSLRIKGELF